MLYDAAPNPANGNTLIRVYITQEDAPGKPELVLRDMQGKIIKRYTLTEGGNDITIDTRDMQQGLYTYMLSISGRAYQVKKLSIIH